VDEWKSPAPAAGTAAAPPRTSNGVVAPTASMSAAAGRGRTYGRGGASQVHRIVRVRPHRTVLFGVAARGPNGALLHGVLRTACQGPDTPPLFRLTLNPVLGPVSNAWYRIPFDRPAESPT